MRKQYYRQAVCVVLCYALACAGVYKRPAFAQQADDRQMHLSLSQAIQMALMNNKDIELAHQNVLASDWDLKGVVAQYDLRSTFSSFYDRSKTPVASFLSGGINGAINQTDLMGGYRLDGFAPKGGGTYQVDFSSHRSTTDNIFAALNPQYPSELWLRYTQPLGRGRTFPNRVKEIEIAKKNSQLTDTHLRRIVADTVLNVQRAYWDLVFARQNLTVQGEILRDTRGQLELTQRRVATGMAAAIDAARPEARVGESEENVSRATEQLVRAENAVKNLIAENSGSKLWDVSLTPSEALTSEIPVMTLQQMLTAAMHNRVELEETEVVREINAIEERYYQDQTRPQIDLVGSYGMLGESGQFIYNRAMSPLIAPIALLTIPESLKGGYGQSLSNLIQNRFDSVRVGVQISLPFHNHAAEAQLGRARVETQRVATEREKLKQLVEMDVRNAYEAVHATDSRLHAASAVRTSLEQQYGSEQRRLNVGYSTADVVLDRQIGVAAARINELRAQTEEHKALAELEHAMGTALEANQIVLRGR